MLPLAIWYFPAKATTTFLYITDFAKVDHFTVSVSLYSVLYNKRYFLSLFLLFLLKKRDDLSLMCGHRVRLDQKSNHSSKAFSGSA